MTYKAFSRALGALGVGLLAAAVVSGPSSASASLAPSLLGTAVTVNLTKSCTSAEGHKATIYITGSASKPTIQYKIENSSGTRPVNITDWGTLPTKSSSFSSIQDGVKRSAGTLPYTRGKGDINFQPTFGKNWAGGTKYCNINFNF